MSDTKTVANQAVGQAVAMTQAESKPQMVQYEPLPSKEGDDIPFPTSAKDLVGQPVFVRTVTFYYIGRLRVVSEDGFYVLTEASWIPSTNRWANVVYRGVDELREIEPYPDSTPALINKDTVVEILPWKFPLPREQK